MTDGLLKQTPLGQRMAFVVETGVALPADLEAGQKRGRKREPVTPIGRAICALEPGQSILFADHDGYEVATRRLSLLAPKRFVSRKTKDGWRVWRLA